MSDEIKCPRCGATLGPGAPEGECPRCLLAAGLESAVSIPAAAGGEGAGGAGAAGDAAAGPAAADPAPRPFPTAPSPEEIGKHFPQLEVLELLGQGGMGIVYKARQKSLDRLVALKVMPPEAAREAGFADRFSREARTLARLQHANIVAIHDFGVSDGLYFLLMEYVDGANLRRAMRDGKLTPSQALAIVPQICDALQYAHENGVVHRDVKPENILLDRAGRVRIADFGLAKIVQRTAVDVTLTRAGQVMGTLHYMAPEQYRTPDAVDHRADIYSLGVVFYEMLTGELPLGSFPPPSEKAHTDVRLDRVVMRALEGERDRRWQHASDMKDGVSAIAAGVAAGIAAAGTPPAPVAVPAVAAAASVAAPAVVGRPSRLATAGGLGVPAAIVLGLATWAIGATFGGGDWVYGAAAAVSTVVLFAGWVASIVAWARIHHAGGALGGKGWAVTGTFLPLAFLCCGWPVLAMTPGVSVKEGPDGTHVKMPFLDVQETADGTTRVKMPGIDVEDGPDGSRVKLPGVEVRDRDGRTHVKVSDLAVTVGDHVEAAHVTGGAETLTEDERAALVATMRILWNADAHRAVHDAKVGRMSAKGFRFFHLALQGNGDRGRLVMNDSTRTVALGVELDGDGWKFDPAYVELRDGPPTDAYRDGWLTR